MFDGNVATADYGGAVAIFSGGGSLTIGEYVLAPASILNAITVISYGLFCEAQAVVP